MSALIWFGLAVVCFGLVIVDRVRHERKGYDPAAKERLREAKRRMMRFPPRWALYVAAPIAGVSLAAHQWLVAEVAFVVAIVMYGFAEQHRREVLRDLGFRLTQWGDAEVPNAGPRSDQPTDG